MRVERWEGLGCLTLVAVGLGLLYLIARAGAWALVVVPLGMLVCILWAGMGRKP